MQRSKIAILVATVLLTSCQAVPGRERIIADTRELKDRLDRGEELEGWSVQVTGELELGSLASARLLLPTESGAGHSCIQIIPNTIKGEYISGEYKIDGVLVYIDASKFVGRFKFEGQEITPVCTTSYYLSIISHRRLFELRTSPK